MSELPFLNCCSFEDFHNRFPPASSVSIFVTAVQSEINRVSRKQRRNWRYARRWFIAKMRLPLFRSSSEGGQSRPQSRNRSAPLQWLKTGLSASQQAAPNSYRNKAPRLGVRVLTSTRDERSQRHEPAKLPTASISSPHLISRHPRDLYSSFPLTRLPASQALAPSGSSGRRRDVRLPSYTNVCGHHGVGVDPEEQQLGDLIASERERQRWRRHKNKHQQQQPEHRRRFRCLNDRLVRSKLIGCLLSAIVLLIILSVCKWFPVPSFPVSHDHFDHLYTSLPSQLTQSVSSIIIRSLARRLNEAIGPTIPHHLRPHHHTPHHPLLSFPRSLLHARSPHAATKKPFNRRPQ